MFRDASGLIARNPPALHAGVAVTDADGDGRFEFVVAGFGGPNRVLRWTGSQLRDAAPPELADPDRQAVGLAAGDLDGDGREELYVLNADTHAGPKRAADRLMKRDAGGRWADLFARPENHPARNLAAGRSVAVIDRRGVGRYGFVVANHGRPARLFELGPDGGLADLAPALGLARTAGGRALLALPLYGDRPDIFCGNENGPNHYYRNLGDGTFAECAGEHGLCDPAEHARGVAALDADGDGRLDLAWGNWDGPHRLMVRVPENGRFRDRATPGLAFPSLARTVVAADFDNDGFDEVFFNNLGEPNRLFRVTPAAPGDPDVRMTDPGDALDPDGYGTGAAVADIDGDGVLELLVAHGESAPQPLSLFKAGAAGNGWLRVLPLTRFGAPARGAVVRLSAGGRERVKAVDAGSGYLCQMEPVAHFGLGPDPRPEGVTVTWPDGATATVYDPKPNTTLTVPHPDA